MSINTSSTDILYADIGMIIFPLFFKDTGANMVCISQIDVKVCVYFKTCNNDRVESNINLTISLSCSTCTLNRLIYHYVTVN